MRATSRSQTNLLITQLAIRPIICGEKMLYATEEESVFHFGSESDGIPANTDCTWTIENKWKNEKPNTSILTHTHTLFLRLQKSESNQCVKFPSIGASKFEIICAENGRSVFESTEESVTMYFSGEKNDEQLGQFSVYYKLENCGARKLHVSDEEKTFDIYSGSGDIPEDHRCARKIYAHNGKPFEIKLHHSNKSESNQCVKFPSIGASKFEIICAENGRSVFESTEESVTMYFSGEKNDEQLGQFSVYYKLGKSAGKLCGPVLYVVLFFCALILFE
ncbi:hypothetical protein FGIG_10683 [Fasciola gigantica]|uniref:CUB domain-containing protein n=1 Tax=Fasciola gigantica TaxID=46835 RepID=A0A504Z3M0_FASGI|nr:hypothetical protein FGIG_10683 [Fasciola gigantica]